MSSRKMLIAALLVFTYGFALSQQVTDIGSEVTFRNGIHLRVTTRQTAPNRSLIFDHLTLSPPDTVHRLFTDNHNHFRFGYDINAVPTSEAGRFQIQLKPLDTGFSSALAQQPVKVRTFESLRKIGPLRVGDSVPVELFVDPASGDKITDVIQVLGVADSPESTNAANRSPALASTPTASFQLTDLRVWVNGKEITAQRPLRSVSGQYPALYIPGHGSFFIALQPLENLPFVQAGTVTHSKLRFTVGPDLIECTSRTPILATQDGAPIWVWHDAYYRLTIPQFDDFIGPSDPNKVQIAVADSIDVWRDMVFEHGR